MAQSDYPNRPINFIIPFPPGGSTTIVVRSISDKLGEALGQQIVIDNRSGAGGTVGTRALARSEPDGYTIGLGYSGTLAIGPNLYPNVGYDIRKDFAPIGRIGTAPNTLVVHPSFNVKSVPELIAYAKANPAKVNFGSAGNGSPQILEKLHAELAARGFDRITIVPMFLARGGHLRRDLPALVESLQRAHPGLHLRTTPAIGEDGDMLDALAQWAGRHGGLPWGPA